MNPRKNVFEPRCKGSSKCEVRLPGLLINFNFHVLYYMKYTFTCTAPATTNTVNNEDEGKMENTSWLQCIYAVCIHKSHFKYFPIHTRASYIVGSFSYLPEFTQCAHMALQFLQFCSACCRHC